MPAVIQVLENLCRKATLFEELGQRIRNLVQVFPFHLAPVIALLDMANGHRDDDAVGNQVAEIQLALDLGFGRECAILLVIIVDKFKDIAVVLFFGANQGLDATLERERKEGIFPCHELVEFLYALGLRGQEVVVFQQFDNLNQEIRVCKVNAVARSFRAVPEVVRILVKNLQHRVSREQIVVQANHLLPREAELHIGVHKAKYKNVSCPPQQIKHLQKIYYKTLYTG